MSKKSRTKKNPLDPKTTVPSGVGFGREPVVDKTPAPVVSPEPKEQPVANVSVRSEPFLKKLNELAPDGPLPPETKDTPDGPLPPETKDAPVVEGLDLYRIKTRAYLFSRPSGTSPIVKTLNVNTQLNVRHHGAWLEASLVSDATVRGFVLRSFTQKV